MVTRRTSKAVIVVGLLFVASCGTASVTETGSTIESRKSETTGVTSSSEPSTTATTPAQNPATTEPTRVDTPTTTASSSQDGVFFPKLKGPQKGSMTTTGRGQLILSDKGCLRLKAGKGTSLLIWPSDYSLDTKGSRVRILNGNRRIVAEVGNYVEVGGGELPSLQLEAIPESLRQKLPGRCSPPYHAVGDEVNVLQE